MATRSDRFLSTLQARPLILDAAMGTRLLRLGLKLDRDDPALWNLSRPEAVADVHARDRRAGADALTANTFGANRCWLSRYGRAADSAAINERAVALARAAAGAAGFVIGDVGPTALGAPGALRDQIRALTAAGVDALLFETFRLDQAAAALAEAAGRAGVPLLVSLFEWPDPIAAAAARLIAAGADVLGVNCRPGAAAALEFAERIHGATDRPLLVRPSAADPDDPERDAAALAAAVPRLRDLGVRLFGGCCGTAEAHVAALRAACYAGASPQPRADGTGPPPRSEPEPA